MGTKGASENNGDMIGTNTGNVITKVKCSILVIPKKATYHPLRSVVFPTDFNIHYNNPNEMIDKDRKMCKPYTCEEADIKNIIE